MKSAEITELFVRSANRYWEFLRDLETWNQETQEVYYSLRKKYYYYRKLHAKDLGIHKIMPESMWPR